VPKTTAAKKLPEREFTTEELVALHLSMLAKGKKHYKVSDAALKAVRPKIKIGEVIVLPDAKTIPKSLRGKRFCLKSKGDFFPVGQTARAVEFEEVIALV
jgi:hypothetical protein